MGTRLGGKGNRRFPLRIIVYVYEMGLHINLSASQILGFSRLLDTFLRYGTHIISFHFIQPEMSQKGDIT